VITCRHRAIKIPISFQQKFIIPINADKGYRLPVNLCHGKKFWRYHGYFISMIHGLNRGQGFGQANELLFQSHGTEGEAAVAYLNALLPGNYQYVCAVTGQLFFKAVTHQRRHLPQADHRSNAKGKNRNKKRGAKPLGPGVTKGEGKEVQFSISSSSRCCPAASAMSVQMTEALIKRPAKNKATPSMQSKNT
jgi:hypothetical protein